jgi:quercetin dioxygenase-like cupin family protein
MPIVTAAEKRRTETPNATMITLASPTLGGTAGLSLWRVSMRAGSRGPLHVVDSEQVWTVLAGAVTITLGDEEHELRSGDTIVLPASVARRIEATRPAQFLVCGHGTASVSVPGEEAPRGTPPWIA